MTSGLPIQVGKNNLEVSAEFPEDLSTRTAWWCRRLGIRDNGDATELPMPLGDRFEHGDAFGTDRQTVSRVLDVASRDHRAVDGLERGPDEKVRELRVGVE